MAENIFKKPDAQLIELIKKAGSNDRAESLAAQVEIAKAIETPLRQGILLGDVVRGLFNAFTLEPGASVEWPLDLLAPGEEDEFVAYTNPGNGRIPERQVEGDYVQIPTFGTASSIDMLRRYASDARWDVVARALQVLEASFVKKVNDDGWHTILSAAADRNILVFDADASAGQFTKRLISIMKIIMRRNGGGNTASIKRFKLTDMFLSPEALEDIRNWGLDQVDELTRREIYQAADGSISRVFGVNLNDMDEFGEGQEYQSYFTTQLGGALATSDLELVVGLDMSNNDTMIMPIRQEVNIYEDPSFHRQGRLSWYGDMDCGYAILDGRVCLLGSF